MKNNETGSFTIALALLCGVVVGVNAVLWPKEFSIRNVKVGECLAIDKGDFGITPPMPDHIDKIVAKGRDGMTENGYVLISDTGKYVLSSENATYEWYKFDGHVVIECPEEVK